MKTIKDIRYGNLQIVVKELGSQQALADLLDKAHAQINQLVNKRRSVGNMIAREIEQKTGKPNGWMDTDHGLNNVTPIAIKETHKVPLISWVQAGEWCKAVDLFQPGDADQWLSCPVPHSEYTYALTVHGDSMTAQTVGIRSYPEGSTIFVDPLKRDPVNGDRIIACIEGDNRVTFKVFKSEDGEVWLEPINTRHKPIYDPFKVIGTVIGVWQE